MGDPEIRARGDKAADIEEMKPELYCDSDVYRMKSRPGTRKKSYRGKDLGTTFYGFAQALWPRNRIDHSQKRAGTGGRQSRPIGRRIPERACGF